MSRWTRTSWANGAAKTGDTLRARALHAISVTQWVPASGQNRINGMIEARPDWVLSRQRAWGVPIAVFVREKGDGSAEILQDDDVNKRIADAFETEGADAWYRDGARERFLGPKANEDWQKVDDILDVWFDSGSTHAFVLEDPVHFPGLAGIKRKVDGGADTVMYLEGSDQHRGWFQSSLLESCGTRGRAPFDIVLTHGFTQAEDGRKMSKSLGNTIEPQAVIKESGADILRLWVAACDYSDDQRIGPEILKNTVETYRKLRNTIRWMLGTLHHFKKADAVAHKDMPELERLMLHELAQRAEKVRRAYAEFDYKSVVAELSAFMNSELSAFYFDIRKDTLYCDPPSSLARKAALTTIDLLCDAIVKWLAPVLSFTCDEAWSMYKPGEKPSVHLTLFPVDFEKFRDEQLAKRWDTIRDVRRVVTGALELERAAKNIGSSLEASPVIYVSDRNLLATLFDVDLAEVCITSNYEVQEGDGAGQRLPPRQRPRRRRGGRESSGHQMRAVVEDPHLRRRGQGVSRRLAARRQGVARMEGAGSDSVTSPLRSGIIAAVATLLIDQASKLWLLHVFDLGHRYPPRVPITPFFDLELAWNIGISFGWLQNDSQIVQLGLMAVKALAVVALAIWMARSRTLLATIALGLIIGGAIGNAIDRLAYGAVVDFALFHVDIGGNPYYWYVFNLADSAIVAGVIALLYDSLVGVSAAKAP